MRLNSLKPAPGSRRTRLRVGRGLVLRMDPQSRANDSQAPEKLSTVLVHVSAFLSPDSIPQSRSRFESPRPESAVGAPQSSWQAKAPAHLRSRVS